MKANSDLKHVKDSLAAEKKKKKTLLKSFDDVSLWYYCNYCKLIYYFVYFTTLPEARSCLPAYLNQLKERRLRILLLLNSLYFIRKDQAITAYKFTSSFWPFQGSISTEKQRKRTKEAKWSSCEAGADKPSRQQCSSSGSGSFPCCVSRIIQ